MAHEDRKIRFSFDSLEEVAKPIKVAAYLEFRELIHLQSTRFACNAHTEFSHKWCYNILFVGSVSTDLELGFVMS